MGPAAEFLTLADDRQYEEDANARRVAQQEARGIGSDREDSSMAKAARPAFEAQIRPAQESLFPILPSMAPL